MENAVDALKIAFGILVFVIAITVSFNLLSQAKSTADVVLYSSDKTNYYTYEEQKSQNIVGVDTVVLALQRFYTEGVTVIISIDGNENKFLPKDEKYKNLAEEFIQKELLKTYQNVQFEETFSETAIGEITITYTKK